MVAFNTAMTADMQRIRVVSFDAEGTLASHAFSRSIWQEVVPALYAQQRGLALDDATRRVFAEYATIGPGRPEWYDIGYWFDRLGLGEPAPVIEQYRLLIEFYPEVEQVLGALGKRYMLVVASSTPLEFLRPLLRDVEHWFAHMFSSTSSCGRLKDAGFFRWMCLQLGVASGEVLHVGDHRERDYDSARQAGIVGLYLDRSGQSPSAATSLNHLLGLLAVDGAEGIACDQCEAT